MTKPGSIALWLFPESDFDSWCEFIGGRPSAYPTFGHYESDILHAAALAQRNQISVILSRVSVANMKHYLDEANLENNHQNRIKGMIATESFQAGSGQAATEAAPDLVTLLGGSTVPIPDGGLTEQLRRLLETGNDQNDLPDFRFSSESDSQ